MLDAKSWFIENYQDTIAEPSEGLFPDPRFSCKHLGITPPASVTASTAWYWEHLADCGGAWSLRYDVDGVALFLVFCGTDGDEGAVEIFDTAGHPLASAFLCGSEQIWEAQAEIRRRFGDLYGLDE
jgi:hypothetical protein